MAEESAAELNAIDPKVLRGMAAAGWCAPLQ